MNQQTKACFKKEILSFFRTYRFLIFVLILVGWAGLSPLMVRGLGLTLEAFTPIYEEFGMDVSEVVDTLAGRASIGLINAVASIGAVGLISYLILINSFAGGEQKKRSIMIPKSSGLSNFSYLFPKYIIYPLAALVISVVAAAVAWGVSVMTFELNDVTFQGALLGGVLAGISLMFYTCIHLTLGTASSRPAMSSVVCIIASQMLPDIFSALGSDMVYNPFLIGALAAEAAFVGNIRMFVSAEIIITIIIAFVLMIALFYIALFAQNAKRVDNRGNEIRL